MELNRPGDIFTQTDTTTESWVLQKIESLNQFLPSEVANKRGASDVIANKWKRYKWAWDKALQIFPKKERKEGRVNVTIISDRVRLLDVENLYGGAKPIRDTLQKRGWLWNDSPKWGDLKISQRRVKKGEEKTWIKLELDKPADNTVS